MNTFSKWKKLKLSDKNIKEIDDILEGEHFGSLEKTLRPLCIYCSQKSKFTDKEKVNIAIYFKKYDIKYFLDFLDCLGEAYYAFAKSHQSTRFVKELLFKDRGASLWGTCFDMNLISKKEFKGQVLKIHKMYENYQA